MTASAQILADVLAKTSAFFAQKGIESPRLEAEILLAHALQLKRIDLYLQFEKRLTESELSACRELVKRRLQGEPVAYILNKREFYGRDFYVDQSVLIPRPETEELVANACELMSRSFGMDVDLAGFEFGVGSGVISVSLLLERPHLVMQAIDISQDAIDVARRNAETHRVTDRLNLVCGDLSTQNAGLYDLIIANPPYATDDEWDKLDVTIRNYEPKIAIVADDQGLAHYRAITAWAKSHLAIGGILCFEIGETQAQMVSDMVSLAFESEVSVNKDLAGHDRMIVAKRRGKWIKSSSKAVPA